EEPWFPAASVHVTTSWNESAVMLRPSPFILTEPPFLPAAFRRTVSPFETAMPFSSADAVLPAPQVATTVNFPDCALPFTTPFAFGTSIAVAAGDAALDTVLPPSSVTVTVTAWPPHPGCDALTMKWPPPIDVTVPVDVEPSPQWMVAVKSETG